MKTIEEARHQILQTLSPLTGATTLPLLESVGRVIAEDYHAKMDVPPQANSAMDGFALQYADLEQAVSSRNQTTLTLPVRQRIPAGHAPNPLEKMTAARIFTGAVTPSNCDIVVMQENCTYDELNQTVTVHLDRFSPEPQANIRPQGQDIAKHSVLYRKGHILRPQDLGILASVGIAQVSVSEKPKVALISTGDELVDPANRTALQPGQIYNSNKPMLHALLTQLGCDVIDLGIVQDTPQEVEKAFKRASAIADFMISTGGVSVGEEDHIKGVIEKLGQLQLWKIKIKPGKPLAFGSIGRTPFMGLPGNPVSAFVTFLLFGAPIIRALLDVERTFPLPQKAPANFEVLKPRLRPEFARAQLSENGIDTYQNQSSGVLASVAWASHLVRIPEDRVISKGDPLEIYPIGSLTQL